MVHSSNVWSLKDVAPSNSLSNIATGLCISFVKPLFASMASPASPAIVGIRSRHRSSMAPCTEVPGQPTNDRYPDANEILGCAHRGPCITISVTILPENHGACQCEQFRSANRHHPEWFHELSSVLKYCSLESSLFPVSSRSVKA